MMLNLYYFAAIVGWAALTTMIVRFVPNAPGIFTRNVGILGVFMLLFLALCVVLFGIIPPSILHSLNQVGFSPPPGYSPNIFKIGLVGNLAQIVGVVCAFRILWHCWPLAIGLGTVVVFGLNYL